MRVASLALGLFTSVVAHACGGVSPRNVPVVFQGQTDIVVWDEQLGVEHFVRNARFSATEDVAFLAPTPSVPTIAEVSSGAFTQLTKLTVPPKFVKVAGGGGLGGQGGGGVEPPPRPVVIVEMMDVGSYTAAILQASDAEGLRTWLTDNGFPAPDWLESWAEPYLRSHWTITAFKLKKGKTRATGPIRMTFRTDRPFAPYAVPKENGGRGSKLRLFLVSESQMTGRINGEAWGGQEIGRTIPTDAQTETLAGSLGVRSFDMPGRAIVRTFDDEAFGTESSHDLFFFRVTPSPEPRREEMSLLSGMGMCSLCTVGTAVRRRRPRADLCGERT